MAKCKNCDSSSMLGWNYQEGLCPQCYEALAIFFNSTARVLQESTDIINKSKNNKTRLSRCDLILNHAGLLKEYENKGIDMIAPSPSKTINIFTELRGEILFEGLKEKIDKELANAKKAKTVKTRIRKAEKALRIIEEGRKELNDPARLDELKNQVIDYMNSLKT